ncbi:MAG TPA: hypothetical protein PLP88_13245 [Bacteroidales bacterium]|nr:hypothetical protein [Bacteroidales bacterium]
MKISSLRIILYYGIGLLAMSACSKSGNQESTVSQSVQVEAPAEKPGKTPQITEQDMTRLNQFDPTKVSSEIIMKNSAEVYTGDNSRAFAFNEVQNNAVTCLIYGGISEDKKCPKWFSQKILQWDPASRQWKTYFDSGVKYNSVIAEDHKVAAGSWYYTVQWVWDPSANDWIKFDADLLFNAKNG